ncbi:MAG: hypothetical protein JZU64_05145 [Rhodoferax sp.]|jgi:hypothetical protein|nr:hypothetical protein [Rhodoferax sp.]
MQRLFLISVFWAAATWSVLAQDAIYRCGNEYTNTKPDAKARGCKLIDAGNVTVVPTARVPKAAGTSAARAGSASRIESIEQKARDSDARLILQDELKKAQLRQQELLKEYNNGEPEKQGGEARNYQKYLDRVAELKASLARNESDIAGIRRELERLPGGASAPPTR